MSDHKRSTQEHTKTPEAAKQQVEQQNSGKKAEGKAETTGAQPGMPERNTKQEPNPGPGVTSQGHSVDENTPAHSDDQDSDRKQPNATDMPSNDKPRDQDKDRRDRMDDHNSGDKKPEHAEGQTH